MTGYHDKRHWYILIIKELFDNAIDFLWKRYPGSNIYNKIIASIEIDEANALIRYKVKNPNPDNKPTLLIKDVRNILNYSMTYGTKQNEYIITRGLLGDAMKRIAALGYILMNDATYSKRESTSTAAPTDDSISDSIGHEYWPYPLIIRANSEELHVLVKLYTLMTKKASIDIVKHEKIESTDTDIEITLPLIDEVRSIGHYSYYESSVLAGNMFKEYCQKYMIFNTNISFDIMILDEAKKEQSHKIQVEAQHPIARQWSNITTITRYSLRQFAQKLGGYHDKQKTTVYQALKTFREWNQKPLTQDLNIPLVDIINIPNEQERIRKIEALYHMLLEEAAENFPSGDNKLSLPYAHVKKKDRAAALAQRLADVYPDLDLDLSKTVYDIFNDDEKHVEKTTGGGGYYSHLSKQQEIGFPYALEIIAIPMRIKTLAREPEHSSRFLGAINYTISPHGHIFESSYEWDKKIEYKVKHPQTGKIITESRTEERHADDIQDVLTVYDFSMRGYKNQSHTKIPCVIAVNLISPKVTYQGADKSRIDVAPYRDTITKAVETISKKVPTFRGAKIILAINDKKGDAGYGKVRVVRYTDTEDEDKPAVIEVARMLLNPRADKLDLQTDIPKEKRKVSTTQTNDSFWYNALPIFTQHGMTGREELDREYFKIRCIKQAAAERGYTREQLGIIAAPWAAMYFKGQWYDVSYDTVKELAKKGTDIVFIEKRDIVQALGDYASADGVALVNAHGHLSDYAEELAELAEIEGAHIAILVDFDKPGLKIAYDVPNAIWLGVDIPMLEYFGIDINDPQEISVVDYKPGKKRLSDANLRILLEDPRFPPERVGGKEFLNHHKIEIDAVLTKAGAGEDPEAAKKIWEYLKGILLSEYPTRNYNRAIADKRADTLPKHYPEPIRQFLDYLTKHSMNITEKEADTIEAELEEVEGFISVDEKEKEIEQRLGKLVLDDKKLQDIARILQQHLEPSSLLKSEEGRTNRGKKGR